MDPLLALIQLLRPRAALFGAGLDASGQWGLAFRERHDLLFCWLEVGECQLIRPGCDPVRMAQGDFALVYTSSPFTLASDCSATPIDSETAVDVGGRLRLTLGAGSARPVRLHAGKFLLSEVNRGLLDDLIPPLVHLAAEDPALGRIRTLLAINEAETRDPGPAAEFVIVRLVELILVEILRTRSPATSAGFKGLLAGMADPIMSRALAAMHADVARNWTVDALARLCGMSRSAFATRFRAIVGTTPITYLLHWRIAVAKDALREGRRSVGQIAFDIGFQSLSAFSTAFTREVGCSPKRYAGVNSTPVR